MGSTIWLVALAAVAVVAFALYARERRLRRALAASRTASPRPAGCEAGAVSAQNAIARLAGALAHEVRNPLNTLSLTFQFLERLIGREAQKLERAADIERHLGAGAGEVEKIKRAVEAFVDLTRPRDLAMREVDLSTIVRHVIESERTRRNLEVAGIEFAIEGGPTPAFVDAAALECAIGEVIDNALDAVAPAGGSTPASRRRIDVSCTARPGGTAEIVVRDSGAGFTAPALARVFEPYFSTKPEHAGLGLARARLIVEAHGGHVDAGNRAADCGGAEVRIALPGATRG